MTLLQRHRQHRRGPWQMRPAFPLDPASSQTQDAYQEIVDASGISVGWVDRYNQSVDGQALDITGAPTDRLLYLVSTANPDGVFLEQDHTNNTAWVSFRVLRESNGNPKIELVDRSPCLGPLCGDKAPNR